MIVTGKVGEGGGISLGESTGREGQGGAGREKGRLFSFTPCQKVQVGTLDIMAVQRHFKESRLGTEYFP